MSDADVNAPREFAVIYFEDVDKRPEVFAGEGWQESARVRLARAQDRWSCHLLYSEGVVAELRAQLAAMHRRAQAAEAAAQVTVEDCRRQGVSLGRGLALSAWHAEREKVAVLEAEVTAGRERVRAMRALEAGQVKLWGEEGRWCARRADTSRFSPSAVCTADSPHIAILAALDTDGAAHNEATHDGD